MTDKKEIGLYRISYKDYEQEVNPLHGLVFDYDELDKRLAQLDIHKRIRLMEFMTGIRDVKEITDKEEVVFVAKLLVARISGYISPELNPSTWSLNNHGRNR